MKDNDIIAYLKDQRPSPSLVIDRGSLKSLFSRGGRIRTTRNV